MVPLHFITKSSQTAAAELKHSLESLGSSLLTLSGNVEQSILDVCEKLKLRAVIFNRSVLRSHVALEKRVTGRLQSAGIHVEGFWSNSLPLSESMFSAKNIDLPAVRKHIAKAKHVTDMVAPPEKMPALPSVVASIKQISLAARVGGGTSAALKLLGSMNRRRECLTVSAETDLAITLKTHMDLGAISPRMIANKVQCIVKSLDGATFSELVWRAYASAVYHRAVGVKYSRAVAV